MYIWKFKAKPVEEGSGASSWCSHWRRVIKLDHWENGVYISLETELKPKPGKSKKEWTNGFGYYMLSISKKFTLGSNHTYYDGNHCMYDFGFLHFIMQRDKTCNKCMPDDSCGV